MSAKLQVIADVGTVAVVVSKHLPKCDRVVSLEIRRQVLTHLLTQEFFEQLQLDEDDYALYLQDGAKLELLVSPSLYHKLKNLFRTLQP